MTILVTDIGFGRDDWTDGFATVDEPKATALDLAPDTDLQPLLPRLGDLRMIRVQFPAFADGRGFSIARQLRLAGYTGRLRACGHVLADQYAMARRCGFDEVEIDDALAARQPEEQWLARADWAANDYQTRLRG
ncbi:DUF934 domain-containing protein [Pontibaca salina]|uniref:DUF934 domain-containing protein n=1 Tax=Pontibaca salina TaxID=2795731 RepID=A0A934HRJ3_9RHOB|nr:DUF934 domain-containing protein [Pontibaca salina]MBI6628898.1 DUF934 domain-containing protein [Pontibaca salina]